LDKLTNWQRIQPLGFIIIVRIQKWAYPKSCSICPS
jgi:hypothetical protein